MGNIAGFDAVWQSEGVKKTDLPSIVSGARHDRHARALIALPMTTSMALAMSAPTAASSTADEMPCHKPAKKPAKHCPDCPDMGNCLVRCFPALSALVAETGRLGVVVTSCVPPRAVSDRRRLPDPTTSPTSERLNRALRRDRGRG